ncbi:MAG: VanZ family protein, partial [Thermoanaerobaculia bacterium]
MVTRAGSLRPPLLLALFIVATAPFMLDVRNFLLRSLGDARFPLALAAAFAAAVVVLVAGAIARIRDPHPLHRRLRRGALALAVALLALQIFGFGTGNPIVDWAERIHLLEYGALGTLFYHALRRHRDASALPLAALAVTLVGIVDESMQWW